MKYETATGNSLLRAYNRAARKMAGSNGRLIATEESAGFIMPKDYDKGEGWQIFVRCVRFSESKLRKDPNSGGLLK